jgi:hypothetical protein
METLTMPLFPRCLAALALALPTAGACAAARADSMQADHFFAVRMIQAPGQPTFVIRISEATRASAFIQALKAGKPVRLTSRVVQRPSVWNPGWPFYTERHGLLPTDTLVAGCSSRGPNQLAGHIDRGARIHGTAWCPAVVVVREIRR